jgi:hypothetical protein
MTKVGEQLRSPGDHNIIDRTWCAEVTLEILKCGYQTKLPSRCPVHQLLSNVFCACIPQSNAWRNCSYATRTLIEECPV